MKYKILAEMKKAELAVQQMDIEALDPSQIKTFVMKLKMSVNTFASQLNIYQNTNEALLELENIQTITQQIISSIYTGKRKTIVDQQEQIQQVKNPLGIE